ncbi:TPA: TIM barrel protein [Candidatus Avacholeplasma faecigallinarum]|nr:TIM barrel protein [Candidatus Avacholeplasma faecigallinarum]
MKLGMPILYEFDSIEQNLKLANQLGLDFVELNLNFGYCRKEIEEQTVLALLKKYNLEATLHFYDEADFASYDEVVEAYLKLLKKYASLGKDYIKIVNVHNICGPVVTISGVKNYIYEKEYDEYIKRLIRNLNKAKEILKEFNIELVIENTTIASYMIKTYNDLYENGFYFNYDIGHDNNDNDMLLKITEKIKLPFKEFHIHDGNRKTCHLCLGSGDIDIKKFKDLAILNNSYVVLEVKKQQDVIKSVDYFKKI